MSLLRRRRARAPAQVTITPKRVQFAFADVPRHWAMNDPVVTHLLNALSLSFPEGEKMFVDAVRLWRDTVQDKARQKEISGFIGQEAMHSLAHHDFNEMLAAQGYAEEARGGQKLAQALAAHGREHMSKRHLLAATAGLEHITAVLAHRLLGDPKLIEQLHPSVRDLWIWHAIEEIEHKAVAFDLYQDVCGDYRLRAGIFLTTSGFLASYTARYTWAFLKKDGLHRRPVTLVRGLWRLFGVNGVISRSLPDYLQYLRPDFHPWQQDDSHLIEQWRARLAPAEATPAEDYAASA